MITADTLATFPECPTFGMVGYPMYDVRKIPRASGAERRNRRWSMPLHRYSTPMGNRDEEVIQSILYFWHVMGGEEKTFRYRDYADYLSCKVGETPTATDAPLAETGDSPTTWRLVKRYSYNVALYQDRYIRRPLGATILIANDLGAVQPSTRWTLDEATGILTIEPSFVGTPTTWGGEFDVPCRFDGELGIELADRRISSVTVALKEMREDDE